MPTPQLKSYAEKSGKRLDEVEKYWEEAKEQAAKKFEHGTPRFWAYVSGIVKKRCGLTESVTFRETLLWEMTMKAADLSSHLKRYFDAIARDAARFNHVGDIEDVRVNLDGSVYLFTKDGEAVGFAQVDRKSDDVVEIQNVYVDGKFRGKGVFAKFIWFLKIHEKYNKIYLGDVHSKDTVEAVKKMALRWKPVWEKDGKRVEFDPKTIDDHYGLTKPTGWKILFENDGEFEGWPRFFDPNVLSVKQYYDWLLEI